MLYSQFVLKERSDTSIKPVPSSIFRVTLLEKLKTAARFPSIPG